MSDEYEFYRNELSKFYAREKRMPSYSEAKDLFGVKSKDSAYRIMGKLIASGVVDRDKSGKIIPKNLFRGALKVLGIVEAGFPTPADEDTLDTMSLDEWLIEKREASFMLRVKGDSMIDAGIREGDMIIVERTHSPKVGQIVIAEIDGGWTMKYLRKTDKGFYLEPANKKFKNIYPKTALSIAAVVKAVIRKY